jgi:hypothetical protein
MERLIKVQSHSYWRYVNTARKKAAVIICVALMIVSLCMSVSAIREPVIRFIEKVYDKFTSIIFTENDLSLTYDPADKKSFTFLPEGYELVYEKEYKAGINSKWYNSNTSAEIQLTQYVITNRIELNTEDQEFEHIYINNLLVLYLDYNNVKTMIWYDDKYSYTLICTQNIDYNIMCDMVVELMK